MINTDKIAKAITSVGLSLVDKYGNEAISAEANGVSIYAPTGDRGPRIDNMDEDRAAELQAAAAKKWQSKAKALEAALVAAGCPASIYVDYDEKGHISLSGFCKLSTMTEAAMEKANQDLDHEMPEDFTDFVAPCEFMDDEGTPNVVPEPTNLKDRHGTDDLPPVKEFLEAMVTQNVNRIIQAIIVALKKKTGEFFFSSDVPLFFSRGHERYEGRYAFGEKHVLRFETQKNQLKSISVWPVGASLSTTPLFTIELRVNNAMEALNAIVDAIAEKQPSMMDESAVGHSKALQEGTMDTIQTFVDEIGDTGGSKAALYRKYMKWATDRGIKLVSDITFSGYIDRIRITGAVAEGPSAQEIAIVEGIADDVSPEYDEFESEILNNTVLYKYEMMGEVVKRIVTWDPLYRNAFIYGVGGVGKTFTIMQIVKEYAKPGDVIVFKGAISGFTGLLQVLWENRAGKIIIFDDNDGILAAGNQNAINLLKGAMENSDPRILSYIRFKKGGSPSIAKEGIVIDTDRLHERIVSVYHDGALIAEETVSRDEAAWYAEASGSKFSEKTSHLDPITGKGDLREAYEDEEDDNLDDEWESDDSETDPAYGMSAEDAVPDQFQFKSRVIFISNLLSVPQPLMDRCISIGLLLTKEQILDLIDSKLEAIMAIDAPQVTIDTKREVLAFMRKYVRRIGKPLTFRLFQQLCAIFHTGHPKAKEMAYLTMMGEGQKVVLGR